MHAGSLFWKVRDWEEQNKKDMRIRKIYLASLSNLKKKANINAYSRKKKTFYIV